MDRCRRNRTMLPGWEVTLTLTLTLTLTALCDRAAPPMRRVTDDGDVSRLPDMLVEAAPAEAASAGHEVKPAAGAEPAVASMSRRTLQEAIDDRVGVLRQGGLKEKQVLDAEGDLRVLVEAYAADKPIAEIGLVEAGRIWSAPQSLPPHHRTNPDLRDFDLIVRAEEARRTWMPHSMSFRARGVRQPRPSFAVCCCPRAHCVSRTQAARAAGTTPPETAPSALAASAEAGARRRTS